MHKGQDFESFVNNVIANDKMFEVMDPFTDGKDWNATIKHWLPQTSHIDNFMGVDDLDFLGRFESIQTDFARLCEALDIKGVSLCHVNCTNHEPYQTYYNEDTEIIVATRYQEDIDKFGYKFKE